jgi:diguanylate cyclase (GGDEF)-like protein
VKARQADVATIARRAKEIPSEGGDVADLVRADRLQLLYRQSFPAVFVSVAAATLLALLLWPAADREAVGLWMVILIGTSLARVALFAAYQVKSPSGLAILAWERPYLVTLMASTLTWGLGSAWIMPKDSFLHQAITLVILVGMAGGALSVYSAIRWLAIVTISVILLPATLWVIALEGNPGLVLGLAILLFCVSALRATKVLSQAMQRNFELTYELRQAKEDAERMASTDSLTGLTNRRAFLELATAPVHYCQRNALAVSAIVLDLDHFKQINDTRGHAAGDEAIAHAGRLIQSSLRRSDLCCRWGGEEFVMLLPDTSLAEAALVAEKLREAVAASPVAVPDGGLALTASLGVAEGNESLEALIHRADLALYRAKREGRNRVACDEPAPPSQEKPAAA